jgi:hypothetical protein
MGATKRHKKHNRILQVYLCLLCFFVAAFAVEAKTRPAIMGISLSMSREVALARLKTIGRLEKEERKRQEVWAVNDPRVSHLLIGYDADYRVRYVTAIARTGGPRIRYQEVVDVKHAERSNYQGNYKFTLEAKRGQVAYITIAHGRDPQYLDSYSVKKVDSNEKEID